MQSDIHTRTVPADVALQAVLDFRDKEKSVPEPWINTFLRSTGVDPRDPKGWANGYAVEIVKTFRRADQTPDQSGPQVWRSNCNDEDCPTCS